MFSPDQVSPPLPQWMKDMWRSDSCYTNYGVDGSTCSFFIYLSEVSGVCVCLYVVCACVRARVSVPGCPCPCVCGCPCMCAQWLQCGLIYSLTFSVNSLGDVELPSSLRIHPLHLHAPLTTELFTCELSYSVEFFLQALIWKHVL